jgi:hypothetical protein
MDFRFGTPIAPCQGKNLLLFTTKVITTLQQHQKVTDVSLSRDIYPNLKLRIYTTGIRQNRLARMLGIDEAHLSRIINGFRQPSGDIRAQLANILQSDPEWLFHRLQVSDDRLASDGLLGSEIAKPQFTTR